MELVGSGHSDFAGDGDWAVVGFESAGGHHADGRAADRGFPGLQSCVDADRFAVFGSPWLDAAFGDGRALHDDVERLAVVVVAVHCSAPRYCAMTT